MRMILYQNLPLYSSLTNYTKISKSMRTFRETPCSLRKTKEAWQFHITHAHNMARAGGRTKNWCNKYKNHFNEMKGDVGMSDQQK